MIFKSCEEVEGLRRKVKSEEINGEFVIHYKANPNTNQYEIMNIEPMKGVDAWHYYGDSELFVIKDSYKVAINYITKNYNENPSPVCQNNAECEECHSNLNENGFAEKLSLIVEEKEPLTFEITGVFKKGGENWWNADKTTSCTSCRNNLHDSKMEELQFETLHKKMNKVPCGRCGKIIDLEEYSGVGICHECSRQEMLLEKVDNCDDLDWFKELPLEEQFPSLASAVVYYAPYLIQYVREDLLDETFCLNAIRESSRTIRYIPDHLKIDEFLIKATKERPWILDDIPAKKQTESICWTALEKEPNAIRFIKKPTAEMMMYAYEKDPTLEEYFKI